MKKSIYMRFNLGYNLGLINGIPPCPVSPQNEYSSVLADFPQIRTLPYANARRATIAASAERSAQSSKTRCAKFPVRPFSHRQTQNTETMNEVIIIGATLAAMSVVGMAWIGGYRLGLANGTNAERELADRRINGLLAQENKRKPRARRKSK